MLNNPFLCTLQVLASLLVSQSSEHGCPLDPLPLPSSSVVDCRASTEAYQVACDRCEAEEFIVPVAVSSAPAPASGTNYHVVLPARINCLTSAIPSGGLGSSTTGKMLNNPFLCTLQVLASLFVSQSSEHCCALDPLPLPSSSVVDCRASTEAYQVACDRCEAEEFIVPVAVSSAPAPASGTDYHVVLPARINFLTSQSRGIQSPEPEQSPQPSCSPQRPRPHDVHGRLGSVHNYNPPHILATPHESSEICSSTTPRLKYREQLQWCEC
ncbi:hypothetical protein MRX96_049610 [Rhipicephalus microplus]